MDYAQKRFLINASPEFCHAHVRYLVSSGAVAVSAHPCAYRTELSNAMNLAAFIGRSEVGRTTWKTIFHFARYEHREAGQ